LIRRKPREGKGEMAMYRFVRSGHVKGGTEATKWAKAVDAYLKEKYPGHAWEVHIEVFDDIQALHWTSTYASLAEFEAERAKRAGDAAYQALIRKWVDYMIEGSWQDTLWESL
jgi:hypothetical protein